jgi:hypothetical protein
MLEYSLNGGSTWEAMLPKQTGRYSYDWTVPGANSARCLFRVRDPFGGAQGVSGLFGIGIQGDFNNDNTVNASDRSILVDHLTENKAALLPGADLNGDGMVDLFDLIYFDANFGQ